MNRRFDVKLTPDKTPPAYDTIPRSSALLARLDEPPEPEPAHGRDEVFRLIVEEHPGRAPDEGGDDACQGV